MMIIFNETKQAMVTMEWLSSPVQDMLADAVVATLTKSEAEMKTTGKISTPVPIDQAVFKESLYEMLGEMFGCSCMSKMIKSSNKISLQVSKQGAISKQVLSCTHSLARSSVNTS